MKFKQKNDAERDGREPVSKKELVSRSRNQPSSASIRKLVVLIITLGIVIYAMVEAGKPERWFWLIPPQPINPAPVLDAPTPQEDVGIEKGEEPERNSASIAQPWLREIDSSGYPNAAKEFWSRTMRRLTAQQRVILFRVLKRVRHEQKLSDDELQTAEALLNALSQQRVQFHQDLMNELTFSTEGAEKKAMLANELFESESVWDRAELPAINEFLAGKALSDQQQQNLAKLQAILDTLALSFVADRSAQGWEGDSPAWGRLWEKILYQDLPGSTPVTHLELSAQPEHYRGQSVQVRGWVRGAWREQLPVRELGIDHLYVAVVRPEDSKVTPYYLYLTKWPQDFPPVGERYTAMNQALIAEGIFFKIRTYRDTENKIQHSPMILTKNVLPFAEPRAPPMVYNSLWAQPMWLALVVGTMVVIAGVVAYFAYASNRPIRFQPGPNRTRDIHHELEILAEDPEVKTARERVQDLYE